MFCASPFPPSSHGGLSFLYTYPSVFDKKHCQKQSSAPWIGIRQAFRNIWQRKQSDPKTKKSYSMDLYIHVGWPLYRKYGHAFEAFRLIVSNPDSVLNSLTREIKEIGPNGKEVTKVVPAMTEEVKDALVKNIRSRMTPQPLKIRADVEMKCFQFEGVVHIKAAMRKAEAAGNKDCPVKIKLVAPPSYVLTTQTLDKEQGIEILNSAIVACSLEIEQHKGKIIVKEAPRAVSEREDKLLTDHMAQLDRENEEVDGDEDSEEEEDTGMGDIDLE